jgi:hypothetical protein
MAPAYLSELTPTGDGRRMTFPFPAVNWAAMIWPTELRAIIFALSETQDNPQTANVPLVPGNIFAHSMSPWVQV